MCRPTVLPTRNIRPAPDLPMRLPLVDDAVRRARQMLPIAHRRRRVWEAVDRALIEVRAIHRVETKEVANAIEKALAEVDGVTWVALIAPIGHVVVGLDRTRVEV